MQLIKGTVSREFWLQFFHKSFSSKPLKISFGSFQFFLKILGDICKSRRTTGISNTGGNFATSTAGVVDTGGKFASIVNNTGGKFSAGIKDTGGKLPPVSMTAAANNWEQRQTADTLK
jgi:hypothetical protein